MTGTSPDISARPTPVKQATDAAIAQAASLLQQGGIVAFPTETVFGLGASALSDQAVEALYTLKSRPPDKPFAIMIASLSQAQAIARVEARAADLIQEFWPGPLSLVLPLRENHGLCARAVAGLTAVSLRMPSHPVALALLKQVQIPLVAPSANPSGLPSPTRAIDVARGFTAQQLPFVLADTTPLLGIESTLLDLSGEQPVLLREGAITREAIEAIAGPVTIAQPKPEGGWFLRTPLRMNAVDVRKGEAFLGFGATRFIGAEGIGFVHDMPEHLWRNLSPEGDLHEAAANLYRMVRELDEAGAEAIAVQPIPDKGLGSTINRRLQAAHPRS